MNTQYGPTPGTPTLLCAVCTKQIREGEEHRKLTHGGDIFPVCCGSCEQKFRAQPDLYTVR